MYCLFRDYLIMMKQIIYWYKKYTPLFLQNIVKKLKPVWFEYYRLSRISKKNIDFSGHGETEAVKKYLDTNQNQINYFVDIGASDGVSSSSTLEFAKNPDWSGLSIEFDKIKFSKMNYVYRNYKNVNLANEKVTPGNVVKLFKQYKVPKDLTFINIDIDSYDLDVIRSIFDFDYRPDIVSIEINEKIPPPIYFKVLFNEDHYWKGDHFYGCSLTAAKKEFSKFNYTLADFKLNNAIFVNSVKFPQTKNLDTLTAYNTGYRDVENRKDLFKYNKDVEVLLTLDDKKSVEFIKNLYKEYENMYELSIGEIDE